MASLFSGVTFCIIICLKELERQTKLNGGVPMSNEELTWKSSPPSLINSLLKPKTEIKIKLVRLHTYCGIVFEIISFYF